MFTQIKVTELVKGDVIDAGGSRRHATVESVSEWSTGSVSVQVWSRGKLSQVWFDSRDALATLHSESSLPKHECGYEILVGPINDPDYAYCGMRFAHAGEHGEWKR